MSTQIWRSLRKYSPRAVLATSLALTCALLTACGGTPEAPALSTRLELKVKASDRVNPDEQGRPAPILVRVYELQSSGVFENADFFSLQDKSKPVLGNEVLATEELILQPGGESVIHLDSNPKTVALGVIAEYRALHQSNWRVLHKLPPAKPNRWYSWSSKLELDVDVGENAVSVKARD